MPLTWGLHRRRNTARAPLHKTVRSKGPSRNTERNQQVNAIRWFSSLCKGLQTRTRGPSRAQHLKPLPYSVHSSVLSHQLSLCSHVSLTALEGPPGSTWHPQQGRKLCGAQRVGWSSQNHQQCTPEPQPGGTAYISFIHDEFSGAPDAS